MRLYKPPILSTGTNTRAPTLGGHRYTRQQIDAWRGAGPPTGHTTPPYNGQPFVQTTPPSNGQPFVQTTPPSNGQPFVQTTPPYNGQPFAQTTPPYNGQPFVQTRSPPPYRSKLLSRTPSPPPQSVKTASPPYRSLLTTQTTPSPPTIGEPGEKTGESQHGQPDKPLKVVPDKPQTKQSHLKSETMANVDGDCHDHQGGKEYGQRLENLSTTLDGINKNFLEGGEYKDVEDLEMKLESYKQKFMEFDTDQSGDINEWKLKLMMEKLGQAKTHLELQKMIIEVDTTERGAITYPDFVAMMLGNKSSVLKLILLFEEKMNPPEKPRGVAPKRDLSSLP